MGKGPEAGKGWACSRNRGKTSGWNGEIKELGRKQIRKGLPSLSKSFKFHAQ